MWERLSSRDSRGWKAAPTEKKPLPQKKSRSHSKFETTESIIRAENFHNSPQ
jgi:hypothetical protein